ncbi:MAG: gliding motility protein RemB [Flavobacterium sp.]
MKCFYSILILLGCGIIAQAQVYRESTEKFPVFPACENLQSQELESCFYKEVQNFVYANFVVSEKIKNQNYSGNVIVFFEVTETGNFKVQQVDAIDESLIAESKRVFGLLPQIVPATYNGKPTYARYKIKIPVPLPKSGEPLPKGNSSKKVLQDDEQLWELDSITYEKYNNPEFESHLSIPFSHSYYSQFDSEMNSVGANNHTGSKPFTYKEVSRYYDFKEENQKILKDKKSWWGRKLWNENLVQLQGKDYWFVLNPIFDLQAGKSASITDVNTFVNTRGIQFRGGLGKELNFTTTIYESQGRFSGYFNRYAESIKPSGGNPAIIPGMGIAKPFGSDAYDFPTAEANLTFAPGKYIDMNLGYGRNFIGDGYRSVLLSDGASLYPYFKLNATFWKIKYTVNYTWLKDVRPEVTVDGTYASKYAVNHYLSWNVINRWNFGLFESVVWQNSNNRGFDMSFINPIIFYRSVEFNSSSKAGNALLGFTSKYKLNNRVNFYGQFLIDEFSSGDVFAGDKSWKNKFGYQLGGKYYNAFGVKNLLFQLEYNHVRPYVYSHSEPITNYGHNNQGLGHQWGANFKEFIAIARYHHGRWFADAKMTFGLRGLDYDTAEDNSNYGGNIYKDYDENRPYETGVAIGQGNKTSEKLHIS